jgi:hypothetical protein
MICRQDAVAFPPLPVLRERVGVRVFAFEISDFRFEMKSPHPRPLPEYGSTELAEVRERGMVSGQH